MDTPDQEPGPQRDRILVAASNAFLEFGFEQASTADIARQAKVSKRELYKLFGEKRALLAAVVVELQMSLQSRVRTEWTSGADPRIVLPRAGAAILDFVLSDRFGRLLRIVAAESYRSPDVATQFFALGPREGLKATASYMSSQMQRGTLCHGDSFQMAGDFLDLLIGAQLMTAVILNQSDSQLDRPARIQHAVDVFLRTYGC